MMLKNDDELTPLEVDAEIHRLLSLKIDRFPEYAKSLLEGYATKVEVFDHMIKVAQAAGFESLTEAIAFAKKAKEGQINDAAITACTLMIKGICMTHSREDWSELIESRIRFMLRKWYATTHHS